MAKFIKCEYGISLNPDAIVTFSFYDNTSIVIGPAATDAGREVYFRTVDGQNIKALESEPTVKAFLESVEYPQVINIQINNPTPETVSSNAVAEGLNKPVVPAKKAPAKKPGRPPKTT